MTGPESAMYFMGSIVLTCVTVAFLDWWGRRKERSGQNQATGAPAARR